MNDAQLIQLLLRDARSHGICAQGYSRMLGLDIDALIDYYIQNPDWCLERSFPHIQTLVDHFGDMPHKGIFVSRTFHGETLNDLQTYIFHDCRGTIRTGLNIPRAVIPMLYFANRCRIRIIPVGPPVAPRDRAVIPIYSFGHNDISAKDNAYAIFNRCNLPLL